MPVRYERVGDVALVTFSAPPLNPYSLEPHDEFDGVLDDVLADKPRALVVRSEGKVVSGGVDVAQFHARKTEAELKDLFDRMLELPQRFSSMTLPTIFAAHGLTLTWALEVAVACDLLVASPHAKFGLVERVIGLTPTMGGTQRIAARAGVARAKEIIFTGDVFDAAAFERWNIVNRIFDDADFDGQVLAFAEQLAIGPTQAFAAGKRIISEYEAGGVPRANAATTHIASQLFETQDLHDGMQSFIDHGPGKATFSGH